MTDLLQHPFWQADDLGKPLPDSPFGVSVCLPLWSHVIGYEEKDPEVVGKFQSGYPRFCCPPAVSELFALAEKTHAGAGERCLVFPRLSHAQRCLDFVQRISDCDSAGLCALDWQEHGLGVAIFPAGLYDTARKFWRFCGEVVSTRQACLVLGRTTTDSTHEAGRAASAQIRQRLADLSGQEAADVFLFPSGMAANFAVHRMLTNLFPGRKTAQLDFPYVDVLKLQQMLGSGAHFMPLLTQAEYDDLAHLLKTERLAGIFCEAPSNPLLRCVDFERLLSIRASSQPGVPLVVDDTIATLANVDAFRVADLVTTSLTKSFSGVGDVMAGSVILNRASAHHATFRAYLTGHADHELWHADAIALEENSRDFTDRVAISSRNAQALTDFLRAHPAVAAVWYADQNGGPGLDCIRREGGGHGCLLSFVLKDTSASPAVYDRLRVSKGPSLGTNFTLACPYTLLAHYDELPWAESCGVPRNLIRVSTGLESTGDLVQRFEEALTV